MKVCTLLVILILGGDLIAQTFEVNKHLRNLASGRIDEVRSALPELLARYPSEPGVMLLHGAVIDDAKLALDIYKRITSEFPQSEWADHAQWRIVQFYAVLGDTSKAKTELELFRARYPQSPFLTPASDVVRSALSIGRRNIKAPLHIDPEPESSSPQLTELPKINDTAPPMTKKPEFTEPQSRHIEPEINKLDEPKQVSPTVTIDGNLQGRFREQITHQEDMPQILKESQAFEPTIEIEVLSDSRPTEIFYGLQVGVYSDKASAESERDKFLARRMRTSVVEREINGRMRFAVVIGHYSSLEAAEAAKIIVGQQCDCVPVIYTK
jgi:hypothetical protein